MSAAKSKPASIDPTQPVIDLEDSDHRASLFQRSRHDHSSEIAEDYVELIADLIETSGEARLVDLASHLGVSRPTVNNTIQRLQREGYVESKPYRAIFLTDKGRDVAARSRERHRIVLAFLDAIGVPPDIAEADAEGLEHHVSEQTLAALAQATERLRER
ncbi:MAG: manganese-binding transcriptional regulator MntR [Rhodospirillaceae bacterium]|jgi:DtxR family transcriptional regulator, manganese transport regulator|nr:manganese-binding transcriptional regulator MntR [Rhodospirillaceae bacterium]MBT6137653.1 manganese-binding transcriptional regulator MntR [Rhodospirillaceae bacterium]